MYVIRTTVGTEADARRIADAIVGSSSSPCVHIMKISSTYRWMGSVHTEMEFLLEIKASAEGLKRGIEELKKLHPYDLPAIEWEERSATEETERWISSESGNTP